MHNPFWNNKTLAWQKLNGATFEVDDELSTQHEEELIIIVVLVPMVFPLHYAQANHRVIYLAKCLIVSLVSYSVNQ
jgi:hypothetical protein